MAYRIRELREKKKLTQEPGYDGDDVRDEKYHFHYENDNVKASQTGLVCILAITAPRKPRNRIYPIGNIKHAVQSMGAVQRYLRRGWKCSKKV